MKKTIFQYIKKLNNVIGKKLYLHMTLSIVLSLMQGVGIFILIPLLGIIGIMGQADVTRNGMLASILEKFPAGDTGDYLLYILFIYIFIISIQSIMTRYQTIMNSEIQHSFIESLKNDLHKNLIESKWEFILRKRMSDFNHILTSEINRIANGTNALIRFYSTCIVLFVHIGIAFMLSPELTIFAIVSGSILALFMYPVSKQSKKLGISLTKNTRELYSEISKNFDGFKETKCYGGEAEHMARFENLNQRIKSNMVNSARVQSRIGMLYKIASAVIVSVFCYYIVEISKSDLNTIIIVLFIFSRIWPKLSALQDYLQRILIMLAAFKGYEELVSESRKERGEGGSKEECEISLNESIRLKDVSFKYEGLQGADILNKINMEIKANRTTVITGVSGSGKSTLIDIVMGLLRPQNGEIIIDGEKPLDDSNIKAWRKLISYVPQSSFLFNGSIRENLSWVRREATVAEMEEALRSAAAYDFVGKLPDGLDTLIGDHGVRLSGGERQRLVLARAILKKPSILVLDEATSALDFQNEGFIREALKRLHKELTIIIVTHRLPSAKDADQVYVLENGEIAEKGKPSDLVYLKSAL